MHIKNVNHLEMSELSCSSFLTLVLIMLWLINKLINSIYLNKYYTIFYKYINYLINIKTFYL